MQLTLNLQRFFTILLLWIGATQFANAQSANLLEAPVTLNLENQTATQVLEEIEAQTICSFFYNPRDLKSDKKYSFDNEKLKIKTVLNQLFPNDEIRIKTKGTQIILVKNKIKSKEDRPKANQKYTLSGYIMDAESNETLIGATIFCAEVELGTTTNEYGFYSITLPEGVYEMTFSYVGYNTKIQKIELKNNIDFSAMLSIGNQLEEVVVKADATKYRHAETQMSSNTISLEKVKSIPALMGERDVLKIIQLMPGVQSGGEGTTGLYVRGGGPDQNLMLLDGVPVYNASHLFGFMSTFNGDAIKSVELIKGGFPARYGGRLSSVIDVRMKEGNMNKLHGDFTVGLISGRFNLEGPIIKEKTSFSFSGRRTWLDMFSTPIQKNINKKALATDPKPLTLYNFYDVNAKINHIFSSKSRLYLSTYLGNDHLGFRNNEGASKEKGDMYWGNKLVTARWNYQFNPKLFSNTTVYMSTYDFDFDNEYITELNAPTETTEIYSSKSKIQDLGAKIDFNYIPHPNHHIRTGLKFGQYKFTPTSSYLEVTEAENPKVSVTNESPKITSNEINAYVEDDMIINHRLKLNVGLHVANFSVEKTNYTSFQPRAALSFLINDNSSLKFSATKMTQYLHLLASPGLGLPTDLWVSSTDQIKPENAWQYGVGYTRSLSDGYELTIEGFYKDMDNLLAYKSGYNFFSNSKDWENKVDVGSGISFGGEILLEKTKGKTTGWIGYTLSKSTRTFPNINFGKSFPYKYDRRHDIGVAVIHKKSDRVDFGLVWVYGTGNTYTLGTTNYNALGIDSNNIDFENPFGSLGSTTQIESRNNQRMPAYHRLDLSVNLHKQKKRGSRTWSFGIYNVYSRQNPFVVNRVARNNKLVLEQQSLIPILPYAAYSFKF